MTIPSRWLDLDQPVITKIELRDYTKAVVGMTLLVLRTEYIHDVRTSKHISRDLLSVIISFRTINIPLLLLSISYSSSSPLPSSFFSTLNCTCYVIPYFPVLSALKYDWSDVLFRQP